MPLPKILLALLAMAIIGTNTTFSKIGLGEFPPLLFSFFRFAFILPLAFFIPRPKISWGLLISIALSLGGLHIALVNIGLYLGASAATTSFIIQSGSLFAIFFAYLLLKAKPSLYDFIGIALGSIGLILIFSEKNLSCTLISLGFCLTSAIMWGLGYTLVKKANTAALPITMWMSLLISPFLALSSLLIEGGELVLTSITEATLVGWSSVLFSSWASMLGAGGILMYLMRTEAIAKVAPFNMLIPVFGILTSIIWLNEPLSYRMLIGGLWILLGLSVTLIGKPVLDRLRNKPKLV